MSSNLRVAEPRTSQGAESNHTYLRPSLLEEPPDYALGRFRGGMSTQDPSTRRWTRATARHHADARSGWRFADAQPVAIATRGQAARTWPARTRPVAVLGDKAYSSRAIRTELRSRGTRAVIPQPSDQLRHRKKRGSAGGRPPGFDAQAYKGRNVHRALLQRPQAMAWHRHPLRQTRSRLPRRRCPTRHHHWLATWETRP